MFHTGGPAAEFTNARVIGSSQRTGKDGVGRFDRPRCDDADYGGSGRGQQPKVVVAEDRIEQSDLILGESERLHRLVRNITEMLRIDGAARRPEPRWALPSEIIAAAARRLLFLGI